MWTFNWVTVNVCTVVKNLCENFMTFMHENKLKLFKLLDKTCHMQSGKKGKLRNNL